MKTIKKDWERMENKTKRIIYYLINLEQQEKELDHRPYRIIEDMAIVYGCLKEDGNEIETISYECAKANGWSDDFLWEKAKYNTKELLPVKLEPVSKNFLGHTEDEPIFFLSNKIQRYGAGVILYEDLLQDFSMKYGWNLYLIPTSIHEFLILFDQGFYEEDMLMKILKEFNQHLEKEEFLSDNIYYYEREKGESISLF